MKHQLNSFGKSLAPYLLLPLAVILAFALLDRHDANSFDNAAAPLIIQPQNAHLFERALSHREFEFPDDHGPHNEFMTEWWYFTGNLSTASGERFGYQLTFFRRAINPQSLQQARKTNLTAEHLYLAHFAITDVSANRFSSFERFSRGSAGLAGAEQGMLNVWLENWQVEQVGIGTYQLHAKQDQYELNLTLEESKPAALQGRQGLSPKGPIPGNASYYYSLSRLVSSGTLSTPERIWNVEGLSWMDHEFSTSALAPNQVGWDWFSMQLDDNSEIMLFQIRRDDGTIDPFSSGNIVPANGSSAYLTEPEFQIEVLDHIESIESGATYPAKWRVEIPSRDISIVIEPLIAAQELNVSFVYWEGAVRISGTRGDQSISGYGYVELTGYAHSMQGQF